MVCSVTGALFGSRNVTGSSLLICRRMACGKARPPRSCWLAIWIGVCSTVPETPSIELAARKPSEVSGIGRIEQQQRSLPVFSRQFQQHTPLLIFELEFEAGLARDILDELGVQFQQQQFVPARLEHLHDNAILAAGYHEVLERERALVL